MSKEKPKIPGIQRRPIGELIPGEFHPAAAIAMDSFKKLSLNKLAAWQESLSSSALSGNRLADICSETLDRLMTGLPVSDRYLLGLAWVMRKDLK